MARTGPDCTFPELTERLRGFPKVWVDLACVVDDARSRPAWVNPRGYDMSLIVPGLLLMRLATAHGRELAVVETRLLRADGRPPGLRVTLLVPGHAVTPRVDQPAGQNTTKAQPRDPQSPNGLSAGHPVRCVARSVGMLSRGGLHLPTFAAAMAGLPGDFASWRSSR